MHTTNAVVVGVEEKIEAGAELDVIGRVRLEDEGFEEPSGVGEMPFGRADIGH